MTNTEEHRCQNPKCNKKLVNRRADAKFCDPSCRYAAKAAEREEQGIEPVWLCQGCKYPRQPQAEILQTPIVRRHPGPERRPEWSGYCVLRNCECPVCRPENSQEAVA
jgi:hypothetical protein